jgi:hypothetical protein
VAGRNGGLGSGPNVGGRLPDGHDFEVLGTGLGEAGKGNGIRLDWVWFGGNTRSPAAVTSPHWDCEKAPASRMPSTAIAVAPLARVTDWGVSLRTAALPSWFPFRSVAETPGKPNSVQVPPDRLVNSRLK